MGRIAQKTEELMDIEFLVDDFLHSQATHVHLTKELQSTFSAWDLTLIGAIAKSSICLVSNCQLSKQPENIPVVEICSSYQVP